MSVRPKRTGGAGTNLPLAGVPRTPVFIAGERGVALILVTFIVALATIIVVSLTYSTYISSRMNAAVERSLYAEYLLKSALNFSRVLLKADTTFEDGPQDAWAAFSNGALIPNELLAITEPNLRIELEIVAEKAKFPLKGIISASAATPNLQWRDMAVRLFQELGFDNDKNEIWTSGKFKGRFFKSDELVANLVDYMDPDDVSYDDANFAKGIEGDLPKGTFPNRQISRVGELTSIPGFTPGRLRKLEGLVTAGGRNIIDINVAPPQILRALNKNLGSSEVDQIIAFRSSKAGPFRNQTGDLQNIINNNQVYQDIAPLVDVNSDWYQVIAKVDYGTAS